MTDKIQTMMGVFVNNGAKFVNTGNITLGKGSAGIYITPETRNNPNATVVNSGNITVGDSILNASGVATSTSVGIYATNKTNLTTTGNITVGNKGFALYGNDSTLNVNGGDYDLDELFDCACIPILITYDSKTLKKHTKTTKEFNLELEHEVMKVFDDFKNKISNLTIPIKLHVFLLPLQEKSVLIKKLDEELKRLQ